MKYGWACVIFVSLSNALLIIKCAQIAVCTTGAICSLGSPRTIKIFREYNKEGTNDMLMVWEDRRLYHARIPAAQLPYCNCCETTLWAAIVKRNGPDELR
jgi:hypothetical protein